MSERDYVIAKALGPTPLKAMRAGIVNRSAARAARSAEGMSDGSRLAIPGHNGEHVASYMKPSAMSVRDIEAARSAAVNNIKAGQRGQVRGARRQMKTALGNQAYTQNNIRQVNDDAFAAAKPKPKRDSWDEFLDD